MRARKKLLLTVSVTLSAVASSLALCGAALALSPERHYEMVSPPYKAGYGVGTLVGVAPSGESAIFNSQGVIDGTDSMALDLDYLSRRGSSEWATTPLQPPAELSPVANIEDVSASLEAVLARWSPAPNLGTTVANRQNKYLVHDIDTPDTAENWKTVGGVVLELTDKAQTTASEISASADLCHVLVEGSEGALLPAAEGSAKQLYDLSEGCQGEPGLSLVGLNNEGKLLSPECMALGAEDFGRNSAFNAVSADGSEIFFTAYVEPGSRGCDKSGGAQLFVRLGGSRTLEVSRPLDVSKPFGGCGTAGEVPCPGAAARPFAEFAGASEDGSRVFFTTSAQLEPATDTDSGNDLYMATIGCPAQGECQADERQVTSLVQASRSPIGGEAAEVQNVVSVAPDGARVYFVARGRLADEPNGEGEMPVKGADNLYVYDSASGKVVFIADLCSGPASSGEIEDGQCPRSLEGGAGQRNDLNLWSSGGPEAQTTSDGQFLAFATYARLIAHGAQADVDNARDIYRYDAESEKLDRVSLGEAGHDANGNGEEPTLGAYDASIAEGAVNSGKIYYEHGLASRAISEDGSRIVFMSAEPLSEAAVNKAAANGIENVYEWHEPEGSSEGRVTMVSGGAAEESDRSAVISSSGRDVFFITSEGLVGQDTDGQADLYDARLETEAEEFAQPPAPRHPCSGDACSGPLTTPAPLLVPGSAVQAPGGNLQPPAEATAKKPTRAQQLARALRACAKRPKGRRAACRRAARKRYPRASASAAGRGSR